MKNSLFILLKITFFLTKSLTAQVSDPPDQSASPYFLIQSEGVGTEQFPLLSTKVSVHIVGPIADVVVRQAYKNNGKVPIEATYVFPASSRAAVYDLEMIIGERRIRAEIKEKEKARRDYEAARDDGKRATLLEQQRPNVFQMNVANLMPGDLIQVVMRYTEFIIPENQEYAFIYPTVVGPRYVSDENPGENESFASNPYLHQGENSPSVFDIQVELNLAVPLQSAASSSHQIDITFTDSNKASARLSTNEIFGGNRDFILTYNVSDADVKSGTVLYKYKDENFFLTTIEPPMIKSSAQILPREYIFVVDVSGSMYGFPIETTKALMKDLVSQLRPTDLFNVMLFAGGNSMLSPESLPAITKNLDRAFEMIDQLQGNGSTEILPALRKIYQMPKNTQEWSRSVVIITDGYISVEPEVFDLINKNASKGNVFAFGIGSGVNRFLIEGMAHAGRGEPFIVTRPESAKESALRFRKYIERPVMTDIAFNFSGFDAYDVVPAAVPDLLAERPLYIFGKYRGEARGEIVLTGRQANEEYRQRIRIEKDDIDDRHVAIRYLWAREKIRWNQDFMKLTADEKRKEEITQLGLKYNLLTDYTSFIAIDEFEKVNSDGLITRVKQPLPLPQNVSNYAIGFEMELDGVSLVKKSLLTPVIVPEMIVKSDNSWGKVFAALLKTEMPYWDPLLVKEFLNRELQISITEKRSSSLFTLDGATLNPKQKRMLLLILARIKEGVKAGDRVSIKFETPA